MAAGSRWQPQRHWATSADWVFLSVWLIRKCFKAFPWAATFLGGPKRSSTSAHWPLNRHENHANWLQSTSDAVLFLDIDLAVPTLDFDLAVPALDMTPLAWATRKRTRQGARLRATCIMSIHDSSSRDLWSANVLLHWQTMMFSKTGFSITTRGQRGWFKTSLGELNGTSYLIAAELTCMKKTMVPKGSPCAFWGWSYAKRAVYKTKLFYPRALRNLWQRKVFRGWWMKQWNVRSLQNLRLKVRPQHPPGTPQQHVWSLACCVLQKLGSPASNLCFVICDWKELWTWILWICVKLYYWRKNGLKDGADILNCNHQS
jgi:hypothetical protein